MKDAEGEIRQWVGSCTDIDDQIRATEVLERTVADRTAKLKSVINELESFSYSISHDLRAPLRAMMGFSDALREDYGPQLDPEANRYLSRIGSASRRMDELIKDVLSYTQVSRGELVLQRIEPGKVIADVIDTYPHVDPAKLIVVVEPDLPAVYANESALTQCIANLLGNAAKFVAPGVQPEVHVSATSSEGFVRLHFRDNGIGIAPENLTSVFEIFKRVDHDHEGTGIGLSIVKKAVERMGGAVEVESEVGRGSIFSLKLQAAPPATAATDPDQPLA
jgi:signal transduction histidine kinase